MLEPLGVREIDWMQSMAQPVRGAALVVMKPETTLTRPAWSVARR